MTPVPDAGSLRKWNRMHPIRWVPPDSRSLLDVGCHVGAFLTHCHEFFPDITLAGVEVDADALQRARTALPFSELHQSGAQSLPFDDARFDCLTCIEVLEHVPAADRPPALTEFHRVLRPGGRLVLRTPHSGAFAFLDPHNLRFRFPGLYGRLVGKGARDAGYEGWTHGVVWHHHFSRKELLDLAGQGWNLEACRRGGFVLAPVAEILRWPFYRKGRVENPACKALDRLFDLDLGIPYGPASYDILLVLRKLP